MKNSTEKKHTNTHDVTVSGDASWGVRNNLNDFFDTLSKSNAEGVTKIITRIEKEDEHETDRGD